MVSKQAEEWQLQSELREQMQGYKRMRHQHKHQVRAAFLNCHYFNILFTCRCNNSSLGTRVTWRITSDRRKKELEQMRITYEKELERLRSKHRTELEQRVS